jgi:hypothetical protein
MSIEKSLIPAPAGLGSLSQEEPINIIIVGPDDVEVKVEEKESKFGENLAETLDPGELHSLGSTLLALYDADLQSRRDWLDTYVKGLKLLGLNYQNMTEPWAGACGVFHPLLMESAVKFQAETIMEIFPSAGPVRTKILGKETPEKKEASIRVEEDMNYELTEVMPEYRPEFERLLISLCLSGNGFKKIYFDPALNRQVANFVGAEDIIVPYGAPNLESAERITHRMRKTKNELRKMQVAGFYRDTELGEPMVVMDEVDRQKAMDQGNANYSAIVDKRFQLLEMHVNLDLDADPYHDKDGIELPYVVTIEKGTNTVLSIRRNWLEEDKLKARRQHFVHYGYIPGFGF